MHEPAPESTSKKAQPTQAADAEHAAPEHADDSRMARFEQRGARRFRARDAIVSIGVASVLLVVFVGSSIRKAGLEMNPGIGRSVILLVGRPAAAVADAFPLARIAHDATAWLSPDANISGYRGFAQPVGVSGTAPPPITSDAFDPTTLGLPAPLRRPLTRLLVTGDSLSEPLDQYVAQDLAGKVDVIQDPHIGTAISNTFVVDWAQLAESQVVHDHPQAVVMFIGANEGFPMPGPGGAQVSCCSREWAVLYATRVRRLMNTYRQQGTARVYWITVPAVRGGTKERIVRGVDAAIEVAAQPWADQVRIIDTVPIFTPGGVYRDAMALGGTDTIVRESDGIHLNDAGSSYLAGIVVRELKRDWTFGAKTSRPTS
jgi:hypothetical protein